MARSTRSPAMRTLPAETGGPRYVFAPDEPLRIKNGKYADPQSIGEALAQIAVYNSGYLLPYAVVDAARDPASPLHRFFEWDDRAAAEAYRAVEARRLIRLIRIVDDEREEPPRAFLSVREAEGGGVSYRTAEEVASSRELQEAVLASAQRDLEAFERRFRQLQDVCELVREARERVVARRSRGTEAQGEARPPQ